jgi:HSP20 family protein
MANITRRGDRYTDMPPPGFVGLQRLNRMLDEAFSGWPFSQQGGGVLTSAWVPACDVCEDRDNVEINVEIPGVRPEDVKLTVENNILTIYGEKKEESRTQEQQMHRYERSYGSFERSFALPSSVDPEGIDARYEHGILKITIPKAEKARPREIPVKAGETGSKRVSAGSRNREREREREEQRTPESAS